VLEHDRVAFPFVDVAHLPAEISRYCRWPSSRLRPSTLASTATSCQALPRGRSDPASPQLLDYARQGDAIVVVGIDRLSRNAAEVMTTIRELGERGIVLRSLREGIDTSNAAGRMVTGRPG
jgi:hypothetical protein